ADGSFTFPVEITDGTAYAVTVFTQPDEQICTVSNGSGTLGGADVDAVAVDCINSYAVGGTVSGLIGTVQLQNNGGDTLSVSANGAFVFATALADGAGYSVAVLSQPAGQVCAVSNSAGVLSGADVTGVVVDCAPVLNLELQGIKTFHFTWADTSGETEYRLQEDPDGISGYTQIDTLAADTVSHDLEVFLPGRVNARYILQACNGGDCVDSAPVNVSGTLEAAVGYIKASNSNTLDNFGSALALSTDGATLAVSAPGEDSAAAGIDGNEADNTAASAGAVYVFTKAGGAWSKQAYIKASNSQASDTFGTALALSGDGDTLAVGAPGEGSAATGVGGNQIYDCGGAPVNCATNSGAAYVFTRTAGVWSQQAYLKASNTETGDRFGAALALSADGDTLAVAALGEDSAATGIDSPNDTEDCITLFTQTNCAEGSGAVYVFARSAGTWSHQAYVKASNTQPSATDSGGEIISTGENFGNALALSENGDTLAVGAWHESGEVTGINPVPTLYNKAFSGAAYVFIRSGANWSEEAYIKAFWVDAEDHFGYAVALAADGNTLAVGADGEDSDATGVNIANAQLSNQSQLSGAAYVFTRSGTIWSQEAYIKASNTEPNRAPSPSARDFFGKAVALSANGNTLAVGAPGEESASVGIDGDQADNAAGDAGAVYVFVRDTGTWLQEAYVKASNTDASDGFGNALALSGDSATLAAAATSEDSASTGPGGDQTDNSASEAGAVYLY
ncbi:MAG: hyalin, partial [Gammaproteobacteria bacterium]